MSGNMIKQVETKIIKAILTDAMIVGYRFNIDNDDDQWVFPEPVDDKKLILQELFKTDQEKLLLFRGKEQKPDACIWLIHGSAGHDVIRDYTVNLQNVITTALKLSEFYGSDYDSQSPKRFVEYSYKTAEEVDAFIDGLTIANPDDVEFDESYKKDGKYFVKVQVNVDTHC